MAPVILWGLKERYHLSSGLTDRSFSDSHTEPLLLTLLTLLVSTLQCCHSNSAYLSQTEAGGWLYGLTRLTLIWNQQIVKKKKNVNHLIRVSCSISTLSLLYRELSPTRLWYLNAHYSLWNEAFAVPVETAAMVSCQGTVSRCPLILTPMVLVSGTWVQIPGVWPWKVVWLLSLCFFVGWVVSLTKRVKIHWIFTTYQVLD